MEPPPRNSYFTILPGDLPMTTVPVPTTTTDIPKITIHTAHSIQKKTSQCLRILYPTPSVKSPADPDLAANLLAVALVAKSQVASKAITIAEIMKRRVSEQGDSWYQYSVLSSVIIELTQENLSKNKQNKRQRKKPDSNYRNNQQGKEKGPQNGKGNDEGEEDPYTPTKEKTRPIKKKVPLLTIYISRSPLPEFARLYGEQTGGS